MHQCTLLATAELSCLRQTVKLPKLGINADAVFIHEAVLRVHITQAQTF